MADNVRPNALAGLLLGARDAIPENKEHSISLANMLRGGLGTAAGWMDWRNKLSPDDYAPQEVLAPLFAAGLGSAPVGSLVSGAIRRHTVRGSAMDFPESIPGHAYRGMEAAEYNATIGAGQPVWSRRDYSHGSEGTKFGDDFGTAESYANFGRSDPRKTGHPNYVVEVDAGRLTRDKRDGYLQASEPLPLDHVRRVWRIDPEDGSLVAVPIEWGGK
jgi:hypothetical protein